MEQVELVINVITLFGYGCGVLLMLGALWRFLLSKLQITP